MDGCRRGAGGRAGSNRIGIPAESNPIRPHWIRYRLGLPARHHGTDSTAVLSTEYADPRVRRVVTTAALASQMVNDLYSMAGEDLSDGREFNLPTVLAAEERCSRREAVLRTAIVHDELVHRFEQEAGPVAATGPAELRRFLGGLWAWMGGNHAWHAASKRYHESISQYRNEISSTATREDDQA
ncbi:hypothetical protein ACIBG0_29945 [Nocardia sp. NPDC050630]|uniref:terpene synthase family protein n=1 Tax=Nocardia sp. NPDC050630 TaxID=3364321 RepID=UPI00379B2592